MNKKDLIILKLEELKKIYINNESKKWNLRALSNAISSIKEYNNEIISGLQLKNDVKGIGEKISKRIDEILQTGDLKELHNNDDLNNTVNNSINNSINNSVNSSLNKLLLITGVGLVRAKKWIHLNIKDIDDVKRAIIDKKITTTEHINIGIKYYNDFQKKIPRNEINNIKFFLNNFLLKNINKNILFEICGSYRRGSLESSDIDILISDPTIKSGVNKELLKDIVNKLIHIKFIIDSLTTKGNTKFMGVCKLDNYQIARRIDIRVVSYQSYYTSLIYFTGSKNFNIHLRNKLLQKNYSLNEYFLTDLNDNTKKILNSEKEIFDILKIDYIKPEDRNI